MYYIEISAVSYFVYKIHDSMFILQINHITIEFRMFVIWHFNKANNILLHVHWFEAFHINNRCCILKLWLFISCMIGLISIHALLNNL